jgi:protein SCO1/2
LLDHDGLPFGRERLEGHWSLLFFGYTECPDVCPITLQLVHQAREHLVRTSSGSPPQLIFVSLDSDRDTPASVKAYVQGFDASFLGVVGSSTEIARVEDWVAAAHWPGRGKGRIEHGAFLYAIDPQARASGRIEGIGDPVALAERIGALTSTSVARR